MAMHGTTWWLHDDNIMYSQNRWTVMEQTCHHLSLSMCLDPHTFLDPQTFLDDPILTQANRSSLSQPVVVNKQIMDKQITISLLKCLRNSQPLAQTFFPPSKASWTNILIHALSLVIQFWHRQPPGVALCAPLAGGLKLDLHARQS